MNNEHLDKEYLREQPGLAMAQLLAEVDQELVVEALPEQGRQKAAKQPPFNWYKGLAAVLAMALVFSCSTLAWAMNSLQQEQETTREFYLRHLTPDQLEDVELYGEALNVVQQPEVLFESLNSGDMYKQYIAINRMVELYNDPELRARAVQELQPFLSNPEPKLAEAAAFALDILEQRFESPLLCKMADGSIFFTLFNDYSDYGSYNQLWRIKDGRLESYITFFDPMMYITDLLPSPDGKLLAVSLCSNKSNFVVVINFIDSHFSSELIGSSRALWACQSDEERFADIRIDHETYSGCGNLRWLDNETLEFDAALSYNHTDIVDDVRVVYNYRTDEYSIRAIDRSEFGQP